jgi:hypothetical protein
VAHKFARERYLSALKKDWINTLFA